MTFKELGMGFLKCTITFCTYTQAGIYRLIFFGVILLAYDFFYGGQ